MTFVPIHPDRLSGTTDAGFLPRTGRQPLLALGPSILAQAGLVRLTGVVVLVALLWVAIGWAVAIP